jgi:branched-chain amino acid transport system permease protein
MDDAFVQTIIIGLSNGLIYALVALGYTLVYGIIELINFAHGDVFMLGSMLALTLFLAIGLTSATPLAVAVMMILGVLAFVMGAMALLNVSIERFAYRPLRNAPKLAPLISAIGMSFVLQNVGLVWKGPAVQGFENVIPNVNVLTTVLGLDTGISLTYKQLFVALVTVPLLVGLTWFVKNTRQGKAMRATAQDPNAAGLMGINVDRTIALTFVLGGALAGAAGVVQILFNNATVYTLGFRFGLNAFTSAVLGGIGNIVGAMLGGLTLGIFESVGPSLVLTGLGIPSAHQLKDVVAFLALVLVLIFKPTGLLGERLSEERA